MSKINRNLKTKISRVRSVLSPLNNKFVKVVRYTTIRKPKVTFKQNDLNNQLQFELPQHVPEEILQQNESHQTNQQLTTLLRNNKKPSRKVRKSPRNLTENKNKRSQDLQKVKAEIDKMESKLISKKKETLKELNAAPPRLKKNASKPNIKLEDIENKPSSNEYDPSDYTENYNFIRPTNYPILNNDNKGYYISELKKSAVINDKLPFELGTKVSPTDKNAIKKLRNQLCKWRISESTSNCTEIEDSVGELNSVAGSVIREKPEKDCSPLRSNAETDKTTSSSEIKTCPLDRYLKTEIDTENLSLPSVNLGNLSNLIPLQTKVAYLTREMDKQLETPIIKPSCMKCKENLSESSESGNTEELVDAKFHEATFKKDLCHHCLNKLYEPHSRSKTKDFNIGSHQPIYLTPLNTNNDEQSNQQNISEVDSKYQSTSVKLQPTKSILFNRLQPTVFPEKSEENLHPNINSKRHESTCRVKDDKLSKPSVHWSSNLEKEYTKLNDVKNGIMRSNEKSKTSSEERKTKNVSINTDADIPRVNASFMYVQGSDGDCEKDVKKVFHIQELPGINIRPELTKQNCPNINIISTRKPKSNQNIAMINVVHEKTDYPLPTGSSNKKPIKLPSHHVLRNKDKDRIDSCRKVRRTVSNSVEYYRDQQIIKSDKTKKDVVVPLKLNLLNAVEKLRQNMHSSNDIVKDHLKKLKSSAADLLKYHCYCKSSEELIEVQGHVNDLLNRINLTLELLQDEFMNDRIDKTHLENLGVILQMLCDDIKRIFPESKYSEATDSNKNQDFNNDPCQQNSELSFNSNAEQGCSSENINQRRKVEYIPYRKLYPGRGALKSIEAATTEKERALRLMRIKKFYEINHDLYNIKSLPETESSKDSKKNNEQKNSNFIAALNETFLIRKQEIEIEQGCDDSESIKTKEVEYEEDWEEPDSDTKKSNNTSLEQQQDCEVIVADVHFSKDEIPNKKLHLEPDNRETVSDHSEVLVSAKEKNQKPTISNSDIKYLKPDNKEENKELTENVKASIPYPFLKLTNPQTNSLVEIRFPEAHNNFNSSITVNSCAKQDEIKLSYKRDDRHLKDLNQTAKVDDKSSTVLKALDNQSDVDQREKRKTIPQKSLIQCDNIDCGNSFGVSGTTYEALPSTLIDLIDERLRDVISSYQRPTITIQNKEIQTSRYDTEQLSYEKLTCPIHDHRKFESSNLLRPDHLETKSFKSSAQSSTFTSEKNSVVRDSFSELQIPDVPSIHLNVPEGSNFISKLTNCDNLPIPIETSYVEDGRVENNETNFRNFSESNISLADGINLFRMERLLPLPQTVITDSEPNQSSSNENKYSLGQITDKQSQIQSRSPKIALDEGTTAEIISDNSLLQQDTFKLPPVTTDIDADNNLVIDCEKFVEHEEKSKNTLADAVVQQLPNYKFGLPTDLLPPPSMLNTVIQINEDVAANVQTNSLHYVYTDSDSDSIISCQNFHIRYYNSDEMSEGEIGFVYTSNTYSSGEVKLRSSTGDNSSSFAVSLSEDGHDNLATNKKKNSRLLSSLNYLKPSPRDLSKSSSARSGISSSESVSTETISGRI